MCPLGRAGSTPASGTDFLLCMPAFFLIFHVKRIGAQNKVLPYFVSFLLLLTLLEKSTYCPHDIAFDITDHTPTSMDSKKGVLNEEEAEKLERIAFILKTVAHPLRLGIIHLLEQHPKLSVSEICDMMGSEQSLTSHHLQNMRLKGILSVKRNGRSMMYSLKERDVSLIIECLENCQCNM